METAVLTLHWYHMSPFHSFPIFLAWWPPVKVCRRHNTECIENLMYVQLAVVLLASKNAQQTLFNNQDVCGVLRALRFDVTILFYIYI